MQDNLNLWRYSKKYHIFAIPKLSQKQNKQSFSPFVGVGSGNAPNVVINIGHCNKGVFIHKIITNGNKKESR